MVLFSAKFAVNLPTGFGTKEESGSAFLVAQLLKRICEEPYLFYQSLNQKAHFLLQMMEVAFYLLAESRVCPAPTPCCMIV